MTEKSSARQRSILIVEDDANALHLMRDYLTRAGFRVRTAPDGWEALKRLKDGPVDIVIADHNVADMDGSRFREKSMLNPLTRDLPFLFIIDESQTDNQVRALRSGVDDCIEKPYDPVILVARVQAVIERRRSYEEMVRVDPLTRLLNRPALEKDLEEEFSRARRYERCAAMVLINIDAFAEVNAENGIAMGDLLLTCLAGVILTNIRVMDVAGRFQGSQFILYLPETGEEGATILTRRIQEQLAAISNVVAGYELTFSAGILCVPEDASKLDPALSRLEQALQEAKAVSYGTVFRWNKGTPA